MKKNKSSTLGTILGILGALVGLATTLDIIFYNSTTLVSIAMMLFTGAIYFELCTK